MFNIYIVCVCLQFQLQSFEIVCNTTWAAEDTCCELPAVVSHLSLFCSMITLVAEFDWNINDQAVQFNSP